MKSGKREIVQEMREYKNKIKIELENIESSIYE
jgi:hypothetical protein